MNLATRMRNFEHGGIRLNAIASMAALMMFTLSSAQAAVPPGADIFPPDELIDQMEDASGTSASVAELQTDVSALDERVAELASTDRRVEELTMRLSDTSVRLEEGRQEQQQLADRLRSLETSVKALVAMTEERIADMSQRLASESADVESQEESKDPDVFEDESDQPPDSAADEGDSDTGQEDAAEGSNLEPESDASEAVAEAAADDKEQEEA